MIFADTDELDVCTTQATVEETNDEVNLASKGNIGEGQFFSFGMTSLNNLFTEEKV